MKDNKSSFSESGYAENTVSNFSEYLTDEKPIKTTGTTCDAFSARYENRRVFVKRLKPEHASNSRYRWAFQKEYELGVSLKHKAIPQYIKFTGDTLITEFVDGKTLHQLIKEKDPRLLIEKHIKQWVGQLLDVMYYLHNNNIMHCDIKTDNIMITSETSNLILIDFDKAFTSSQDLTPGTPLNYGTEDETLTKRQMDIRGVRNIIEKLLQYVGSDSLKERVAKVMAAAGSPEMTMPELLEIWKQPITLHTDNKPKSRRVYIGWWIGGLIFIALIVVVWSYLPKESPEVIQPASISPEWNTLLTNDLVPMNKLLDEISDEIQLDKIRSYNVADIVMNINDEMNSFNKDVLDKYSGNFPEISKDDIMLSIYDSEPVKEMVKRRDEILKQLLEIQQQPNHPNKTVFTTSYEVSPSVSEVSSSNFEKQLEADLENYMGVLTQIEEVLDSYDDYPFNKINTKHKIQNMQTDFDNKILIEYPEKFAPLTAQECQYRAYNTPTVVRMVKLRDTVLARLDK